MNKDNEINILLSFDDKDWNYTRHVAVALFSLLETNKRHKIKIYIMTSKLSQENINELKRIVSLYNQKIEFIIDENILSKDLKESIIFNGRKLTRWSRYYLFFPKYIKWIDRILYVDCDVLFMKDIADIYFMDMKWKTIVWYYDAMYPLSYKSKFFWLNNYINSWVLLINTERYDMSKVNAYKMKEINEKFWKYFTGADEEKMNLIFCNEIWIGEKCMNYQITNKYFIKWIDKAKILHCIEKPNVQYASIPKDIKELYYYYLGKTKRKWFPEKKANYGFWRRLYNWLSNIFIHILPKVVWKNTARKVVVFLVGFKKN